VNARSGKHGDGPILVIDDDEIALQAMTDVLEDAGYRVHALASPIGATQVIAARGIIAAVLDLNMPVMRGDRFISLIRSWDRIRDLPIVLVSGEAPSVIREAVAHLPGVSVVTKPRMTELLVSTLEQALSGQVRRDEAAGMITASASLPGPSGDSGLSSRGVSQSARAAQAAWREFTTGRVGSAQPVTRALAHLRSEVQALNLPNTQQLLAVALELASNLVSRQQLSVEADTAMSEMLAQLTVDVDKVRLFERSLALTVQRSRLERARQPLP